jgi:hypothetical protein
MKKNQPSRILMGLAIAMALTSLTWSARANVYATNIKMNGSTSSPTVFAGNNIAISYILNEPASAGVTINILSGSTVIRSIAVAAGNPGTLRGANTVTWDGKNSAGNPVAGGDYSCSVTAQSAGYTGWTKTTSDSNLGNQVWQPRGLAVNKNPNSFYYGRVYVSNSYPGPGAGTGDPRDMLGVQKLNADGSAADEGVFSTGGVAWNGRGFGPWRLEVGSDDRLYAEDWWNYGDVYSFDQQMTAGSERYVMRGTSPDASTVGDNNPNYGNFAGFCVAGTPSSMQLLMADNTTGGIGINQWTIGYDGTLTNGDAGTSIVPIYLGDLDDSCLDVAVDKSNRIYVVCQPSSDTQYKIMRFPAYNGTPAATADWKADNTMNAGNYYGVAVNPAATLVAVTCNESNQVVVLDADTGNTVTNFSVNGQPHKDVTWDNVGNVYTCYDVNLGESFWEAWSPPGANQATTAALQTIHILSLPYITSIDRSGNNVTVHFTGPTSDPPSAFVLMSGTIASGIINDAGATITGSGGTYQAVLSTSAAAQFYRVKRP